MTTPEPDVTFVGGVLRVRWSARSTLPRLVPMAMERTTKGSGRHWACPVLDAPTVTEWADANGVSVSSEVREYAEGLWVRELEAMEQANASSVPESERVEVDGLLTTLLDTQEVVPRAAANCWTNLPDVAKQHRALIIADEPGLGKTLESLASIRLSGQNCERSVIVCPTSLTENWQAEMLQHFDLGVFRPWVAKSTTASLVPADADTVVIGWDVLHAWTDSLIKWKPDALIVDEGHYAKAGRQRTKTQKKTQTVKKDGVAQRDEFGNLVLETVETTKKLSGSARASAVLKIGSATARHGGLIMALTGTPIVNRPVELEPLLDLAGILDLFGGGTTFKNRYCGPKKINVGGRVVTQYQGASNLLELNSRLAASGHYIRRTKEGLVESGLLKPKYVDGVYCYDYASRPNPWIITPTESEMADYLAVEEEAEEFFATRAQEIAQETRSGLNSQKVQQKVQAEGARHLQRIGALRQAAAKVKVKYVVAKVREMNEKGERVVIAAHHREIVNLYAEAFSGLKIQGEMSVPEIERAKALFNSTPIEENPVLVLSVEAGKTGHTLCKQTLHGVGPACAYMVFAEQVWTPGDETQAQDRIWRIGQDREVRIINALLAGSIDLDIFGQRLRKRKVVNAAVDAIGVDNAKAEREGAGTLAWRLAAARFQKAQR